MKLADRRLLTIFIVLILSPLHFLSAQKLGIKGGINFAKFTGSDIENIEFFSGYAFGGCLRLRIQRRMTIQTEFLFSMKGSEKEEAVMDQINKFSTKLTYFEVPVLFEFLIKRRGRWKPMVFVGSSFGWKIKAKLKLESGGDITEEDLENIKNIDFGIIVGGGCIIFNRFTLDLRYDFGLVSINESEGSPNEKNRVASIMIGILL